MARTKATNFRWFCAICHDETASKADPNDRLAEQGAKLETLTQIVKTLQSQNEVILQLLRNENKLEDRIKQQVSESLDDRKEKEDRKCNLIIFNVEESSDTSLAEQKKHDKHEVGKILDFISPGTEVDSVCEQDIVRLGPRKKSQSEDSRPKPRPLKIKFTDEQSRTSILRKARKLKDHQTYKKIGIATDKTQKEREEEKALRTELSNRKQNGENVFIYRGKIVVRTENDSGKQPEPTGSGTDATTTGL